MTGTANWTTQSTFKSPVDSILLSYATLLHPPELPSPSTNDPKSPSTSVIVFLTGFKETFHKYGSLLQNLHSKHGFLVFTMDHRSQGTSFDRQDSLRLKGNGDGSGRRVCHVRDFEEYVEDVRYFIQNVVAPELKGRNDICTTLVGRSMGGLIAARVVELQDERPETLQMDRVALFEPMLLHKSVLDVGSLLQIELPTYMAKMLSILICDILKLSASLAAGADTDAAVPTTERLTHCPIKKGKWDEMRKERPEIVLAGCSFGWAYAAMRCEEETMRDATKVRIPMLVFQAHDDSFVYNSAMDEFVERVGRDRAFLIGPVPGTYHEMLMEVDEVRDPLVAALCEFAKLGSGEAFSDSVITSFRRIPRGIADAGYGKVRWVDGHHSGTFPPRFFPVPLILRERPMLRNFLGYAFLGMVVGLTSHFVYNKLQ